VRRAPRHQTFFRFAGNALSPRRAPVARRSRAASQDTET